MRVSALVDSTQVESPNTRAVNGERGPESKYACTVTFCVVGPGLKTLIDEDPAATSALWGMVHSCSTRGDPATMANPDPFPVNSCSSLATRRPVRVETVVAIFGWSCT